MAKFIDKLGLTAAVSKIKEYIDSSIEAINDTLGTLATSETDGLMSAADKKKLDSLDDIMVYKGSKDNYADLPADGNTNGDVWNVVNAYNDNPAGSNYAWDGSKWDSLGGSFDTSKLQSKIIVKIPALSFADSNVEDGLAMSTIEVTDMPESANPFTYINSLMRSGVSVSAYMEGDDAGETLTIAHSTTSSFLISVRNVNMRFEANPGYATYSVTSELLPDADATTSLHGYMSAEDKTHLDSLWTNLGNIVDGETQRY